MATHLHSRESVINEERAYLKQLRETRPKSATFPDRASDKPIGLALSGGGIRSAIFHLGVLQALASTGILSLVDYLSAVSGGGYVAGWLAQWIHKVGYTDALSELSDKRSPDTLRWLRQNSSYLTPRVGFFGHDTWLLLATYFHNAAINMFLVSLLGIVVLLIPRTVLACLVLSLPNSTPALAVIGGTLALSSLFLLYYRVILQKQAIRDFSVLRLVIVFATLYAGLLFTNRILIFFSFVIAFYFVFSHPKAIFANSLVIISLFSLFAWLDFTNIFSYWIAAYALGLSLMCAIATIWDRYQVKTINRRRLVAIQALASGYCLAASFYPSNSPVLNYPAAPLMQALSDWVTDSQWLVPMALLLWALATVALLAAVAPSILRPFAIPPVLDKYLPLIRFYRSVVAIGILIVYLIKYRYHSVKQLIYTFHQQREPDAAVVLYFIIGVPILLVLGGAVFGILCAALTSFLSQNTSERINGILGTFYLYVMRIMYITVISAFGALTWAHYSWLHRPFMVAVITATLMCLLWPYINSRLSSGVLRDVVRILVSVAPSILLTAWLITLATGTDAYLFHRSGFGRWGELVVINHATAKILFIATPTGILLLWLLSSAFGINQFSMHTFYENRLAHAFLGEQPPGSERTPQTPRLWPGDGAEPTYLNALARPPLGPYVLLNAALNTTDSSDLISQERNALSFVFSPLFCGYANHGRVQDDDTTNRDGYAATKSANHTRGIRLAHAMAVSGSALSTNMGGYSSARIRFIHSLLNVRLGVWIGNPRRMRRWSDDIPPRGGMGLLLAEVLGKTSRSSEYIYLSDGGHFDNLGIYELINRRCAVIVASDASADSKLNCRDLAMVVEKCRIDFGVDIELSPSDIEHARTKAFVAGKIIYPDAPPGVLIYLKAIALPDVPLDLAQYKALNNSFPHQSTFNQWFMESDFECYRMLGECIGLAAASKLKDTGVSSLEEAAKLLKMRSDESTGRDDAAKAGP